jgi:uncharacterized membrane protein
LAEGAAVAASALGGAATSVAAALPAVGDELGAMNKLLRVIKHRWFDASDARRAVPDDMAERLTQRVTASEKRHTGEVRLCVEAALPTADLWRISADTPMSQVVRERALEWFGRLGIWDTEDNNGVLIYLLLAEHTIEIVADRGLSRRVPASDWQAVVARLGEQLHKGAFEDGLTAALTEVSACLVAHFPIKPDDAADSLRPNQLADCVVRV